MSFMQRLAETEQAWADNCRRIGLTELADRVTERAEALRQPLHDTTGPDTEAELVESFRGLGLSEAAAAYAAGIERPMLETRAVPQPTRDVVGRGRMAVQAAIEAAAPFHGSGTREYVNRKLAQECANRSVDDMIVWLEGFAERLNNQRAALKPKA